jgi:two-component system sensor histidine kinase DesK
MASRPMAARRVLIYWMDGLIGFLLLTLIGLCVAGVAQGQISLAHGVAAGACTAAALAFAPFILRAAYDRRPRPTARIAVSGVFAAGSVLLMPAHLSTVNATGIWAAAALFWLSVAALYLTPWATVRAGVALVGGLTAWTALVTRDPWPNVLVLETFSAVTTIYGMRLWRWLWWTIRDAHDGQEAKARLAVSEERLRFARDLHDLLGHSLSVISLKSELAAKLAPRDTGRAAAEMADVRRLAADSLAEVQLAVDGYQALDLDEELAGVCAALESAGARCVIDARAGDLSPTGRALLAWAVREGGTNILKHSTATRCAITIDGGVLEMRNDGVDGCPAAAGSGLRGLSERMAAAGGSFSAAPTPAGEFLLRAAVPA